MPSLRRRAHSEVLLKGHALYVWHKLSVTMILLGGQRQPQILVSGLADDVLGLVGFDRLLFFLTPVSKCVVHAAASY